MAKQKKRRSLIVGLLEGDAVFGHDRISESLIIVLHRFDKEFSYYYDYVDGRWDDEDDLEEDDSILSVSKVSGNHHNMIRQRLGAGRHFSVAGEWFGLKIYADFERVLTGAEDWAAFVSKVAEAINLMYFKVILL